jgi:hypothetical protein
MSAAELGCQLRCTLLFSTCAASVITNGAAGVTVRVGEAVGVGGKVGISVGVSVGVTVDVAVDVTIGVAVGVTVQVAVQVAVQVGSIVGVQGGVVVAIGVSVGSGAATVGVPTNGGVGVTVAGQVALAQLVGVAVGFSASAGCDAAKWVTGRAVSVGITGGATVVGADTRAVGAVATVGSVADALAITGGSSDGFAPTGEGGVRASVTGEAWNRRTVSVCMVRAARGGSAAVVVSTPIVSTLLGTAAGVRGIVGSIANAPTVKAGVGMVDRERGPVAGRGILIVIGGNGVVGSLTITTALMSDCVSRVGVGVALTIGACAAVSARCTRPATSSSDK